MCSTPRSSASSFSRRKNHAATEPEDYKAYAQMLRNASACYERNQELRAAKRLAENAAMPDYANELENPAPSHPENGIKVISLFGKMAGYLKRR